MENQTNKIVIKDIGETKLKSTTFEKASFVKCLQEILEKCFTLREVVTDPHLQIIQLLNIPLYETVQDSLVKNLTCSLFKNNSNTNSTIL